MNDARIEHEVELEITDRVGFGKFILFEIVTTSRLMKSVAEWPNLYSACIIFKRHLSPFQ